jgi:hypothetical protein
MALLTMSHASVKSKNYPQRKPGKELRQVASRKKKNRCPLSIP